MKNVFLFLALALALNCSAQVHEFETYFPSMSHTCNCRSIWPVLDSVKALAPTQDLFSIQLSGYSWEWETLVGVNIPLCQLRTASVQDCIETWRANRGLPPQNYFYKTCTTGIHSGVQLQKVIIYLDRLL